jgi:shikimate dehydrogenase
MVDISGKTRVIVHLCYPAAHLRTPSVFNPWCVAERRDAVLVPWQVRPEHLAEVFHALGHVESLAGVIVTIPHKGAVAAMCDSLTETAHLLGTANVARRDNDGRWYGAMFDGEGLTHGLLRAGHRIEGRRALLLGAGGAATGIAEALVRQGVAELVIANRSPDKAEHLARLLSDAFPDARVAAGPADAKGFDLVVNGTSLGMHDGDPLPVDPATLAPDTLVAEVVMQPDVTPLLIVAEGRGCTIHRGVHMIESQIELLGRFLLD